MRFLLSASVAAIGISFALGSAAMAQDAAQQPAPDTAETDSPAAEQPFVSIHLACCNEPPEMVILTLDSLAALDYANYEVLVIDNNTKREDVWKPVEEYCAKPVSYTHLTLPTSDLV